MSALSRYIEQGYILAALIVLLGAAGLFLDKLTGQQYVTLCGIVVGGFGIKDGAVEYFRCKYSHHPEQPRR